MGELVTLNQRVVKIKFYLNQTAQNIIEIGKELTAAKNEVPHGEWLNWLDNNFGMTVYTAARFMKVADRFSNLTTSANFNSSQMFEMLALPAGETEKFIEQKKAEGKAVEDMTVKTLREEVSKYKADYKKEKEKVENLFADNGRLQAKFDAADKLVNKYHVERDILQKKLENQKPITIEPADYQQLKKARVQLQNKIDALQKELQNKTVEVVTPADYDATKKELARLQAEQSEMVQRMEVFQNLSTIATLIEYVIKSPSNAGIQDFKREHPEEFGKMCAAFLDFTDSFYKE